MIYSFLTRQFSSFTYLNITQFLGALNDNIYKMLIVFFLIEQQGIENSSKILSSTGAVFVLPFLLFSASSGNLADRFSKRNIIVITKILELIVIAVGLMAFAFQSATVSYITLFLLATQSAIFGPSKYGIIPEIVKTEKISSANGLMTSFTFLAIIIGTFLASFITDITNRNFILGALLCTIIALAGVITSFGIQYTPPAGSEKRFNVKFLGEIWTTLKTAKKTPSLLAAIMGSAFFLFFGAFMQLNIIPFAVQSLKLTDVQGGYLFLITALGIGTGSVLAGKISGKTVELGLVPVAAAGITACLFLLDTFSTHLGIIAPLVIITGMLGGLYQIPLDSFIQVASPNQVRGQVVAATNFLSFSGVLLASAFLYLISDVLHLSAATGFSAMAFIAGGVALFYSYQFFDYFTRFLGMVLCRLHFSTKCSGADEIPNHPSLFFCQHTAWNDLLIILGTQRRRIHFFIEQEKEKTPWTSTLYKRAFKITPLTSSQPFHDNKELVANVQATIKNGYSVCFLLEGKDIQNTAAAFATSEAMRTVVNHSGCPVYTVDLKKGNKEKESKGIFKSFAHKMHVPAEVTFTKVATPFHEEHQKI